MWGAFNFDMSSSNHSETFKATFLKVYQATRTWPLVMAELRGRGESGGSGTKGRALALCFNSSFTFHRTRWSSLPNPRLANLTPELLEPPWAEERKCFQYLTHVRADVPARFKVCAQSESCIDIALLGRLQRPIYGIKESKRVWGQFSKAPGKRRNREPKGMTSY